MRDHDAGMTVKERKDESMSKNSVSKYILTNVLSIQLQLLGRGNL